MAPEMFKGEAGDEATDIYALGVTMFRAFTGEFPYGNPDADEPAAPRPAEGALAALRPDLPAWLEAVLGAGDRRRSQPAVSRRHGIRRRDGGGAARARRRRRAGRRRCYESAPVRFWQGVAALLALALLLSLWRR